MNTLWKKMPIKAKILAAGVVIILIYSIAIFFYVIPLTKQNLQSKKEEMLKELTGLAYCSVQGYYNDFKNGKLTEEEAKEMAKAQIRIFRFGAEKKDYFFVTTPDYYTVVHPYRPDLEGTDSSGLTDPDGKKFIVEFANIAKEKGSGFIYYKCLWHADKTRVLDKM